VIYGIGISGYLISRFKSISEPGSSAYFRLISPIKIFATNLGEYPLGVPLGLREMLVISSDERLERNLVTSIDNGWLYILIYFGLIGLVFIASIMIYCLRLSIKLKKLGNDFWIFGFLPLITLGFTGGITMPEFILLYAVMINMIRSFSKQEFLFSANEVRKL
jgi:hypothetical protein